MNLIYKKKFIILLSKITWKLKLVNNYFINNGNILIFE